VNLRPPIIWAPGRDSAPGNPVHSPRPREGLSPKSHRVAALDEKALPARLPSPFFREGVSPRAKEGLLI